MFRSHLIKKFTYFTKSTEKQRGFIKHLFTNVGKNELKLMSSLYSRPFDLCDRIFSKLATL